MVVKGSTLIVWLKLLQTMQILTPNILSAVLSYKSV